MTSEQAYRLIKENNCKWNVIINFDFHLKKWQSQFEHKAAETASTLSSLSQLTVPPSPSSTSSIAVNNSVNIAIVDIFNASAEGKMLLNVYENTNKLTDVQRTLMVNIIVEHFIRMNIKLSTNMCEQIAEQIVTIMPNEVKVNPFHFFY